MSFQSAAVAVSVAQEIGFMVWDSAMERRKLRMRLRPSNGRLLKNWRKR